MNKVKNEISLLRYCDHKNIIKMLDYGCKGTQTFPDGEVLQNLVYITMEYFSGETLLKYIQKSKLNETAARGIFK